MAFWIFLRHTNTSKAVQPRHCLLGSIRERTPFYHGDDSSPAGIPALGTAIWAIDERCR